jgi:hypothetical protein
MTHSEGKRLEEAYGNAQILVQLALFQKLHDGPKTNAVEAYLFCRDIPNQKAFPDLERDARTLLDDDPDLLELVAQTLHVELALCFGHSNRERFEKLLSSMVFTDYCSKCDPPNAKQYEELIERCAQKLINNRKGTMAR